MPNVVSIFRCRSDVGVLIITKALGSFKYLCDKENENVIGAVFKCPWLCWFLPHTLSAVGGVK